MDKYTKTKLITALGILSLIFLMQYTVAEASSGSGVSAWETPLETIVNSLTGPVARFISLGVICLCGFAISQGQTPGIVKTIAMVVIGLAVVLNAASVMNIFGTGAILLA